MKNFRISRVSCAIDSGFLWLLIMFANIVFGGWSVDFLLSLIGKNIPFTFDCIIGFFAGTITIPCAVICYILKYFGVF